MKIGSAPPESTIVGRDDQPGLVRNDHRARLSEQARAPVPLVVPWSVITGVVLLCLVPAVAASLAPTRRRR